MTANHAHTPTTEVIRETYIGEPPYTLYGYTEEEFDRWLATIEAAAEQRGAARELRGVIATYWNESGELQLWKIRNGLRQELERRADQEGDE